MNFRFGGFRKSDLVIAFVGRKEIICGDGLELCADTVDAANPLHQAAWVPRNVIIDDRGGTMKVNAFGENVCRDKDTIIVTLFLHVGVEVGNDFAA